MRPVTLFPALLMTATLLLASGARANILISIDKSTQHMSVSVDGTPRYEWPVSTGRAGYDTPNGTFKANRMDADHFSQEWDNAPMPHAIFFDMNGHAVHGFFDVKHLGRPASHGCVRLSPEHAGTLFDLVTTEGMSNTTIVVSGRDSVKPQSEGGAAARTDRTGCRDCVVRVNANHAAIRPAVGAVLQPTRLRPAPLRAGLLRSGLPAAAILPAVHAVLSARARPTFPRWKPSSSRFSRLRWR